MLRHHHVRWVVALATCGDTCAMPDLHPHISPPEDFSPDNLGDYEV